jgi:hypothetical protein
VIILVDLNQVMIATMMVQLGSHKNAQIDEGMLRHMVLNSLRSNRNKFKDEYGELVICSDDKNYWRRSQFPYYKAARKKSREKSELDWSAIFNALGRIKDELRQFFPYRVIQVETAEADDIIATLVHEYGTPLNSGEPILILSGDKDYIQLHTYGNVRQYDPTRKKWIRHDDPEAYLKEHIIRGDAGDGVPNILSPDNCFVTGIRQKPITKKRLAEWQNLNNLTGEVKRNYLRNKSLIDLSEVPEHIKDQVMEEYENEGGKDRKHLLDYFMKNKLKHLMEVITDF